MLVTLKEILEHAEKDKYGVGLFNMLNLEMARGIIEAAEAERSPLILGIAEVHLPFIPMDYAAPIMHKIASEATVPVCLHFDHGITYENIKRAVDFGFSSVMFDGSALPYEENIAGTKKVVELAHAKGISVEAELGHVGMADVDNDPTAAYTEIEQVNDFIDKTDCDALAVAIGTAHGQYKHKPVLDIQRLADIYAVSKRPLVLHGGSGLSDDDFRNTVKNGIRKVNICTDMCVAALNAYKTSTISFEPTVNLAKDAVKEVVQNKMRLFGSNGKAW